MQGKFVRFLLVGGGCAVLYFILAWAFQAQAELPPFFATIAANAISFCVAYLLQRTWTFRSVATHKVTLPRYATVQVLAALTTATVAQTIAHFYPHASSLTIAAVSTVIASGLSFVLSSVWVFSHDTRAPQ